MERITISMDDELARQLDQLLERRGYKNRSEAMRDLVRDAVESERLQSEEAEHCIGALTYVYNHHERELASRLTRAQHDHHHLALSTMHVHLDHDNCLETVIVRGATPQVRAFSAGLIASTGVRHGHLHLVPVEMETGAHSHHHDGEGEPHLHSRPNV